MRGQHRQPQAAVRNIGHWRWQRCMFSAGRGAFHIKPPRSRAVGWGKPNLATAHWTQAAAVPIFAPHEENLTR